MSEMEKTKRVIMAVLDNSRLSEIEKMKLLSIITADIKSELEEIRSGENKISECWLVCYQVYGYMSVKNVVLRNEHPVYYIARKNDGNPNLYYLVNFWEIDQEKYDELSKYLHFLDF